MGITAIEIAEGKPPLSEVPAHEVKQIEMTCVNVCQLMQRILMQPAPTLKIPGKWSSSFHQFLVECLHKDPNSRTPSAELLMVENVGLYSLW